MIYLLTGLFIHLCAGEHQQRFDPAHHPEHQERFGIPEPDPRESGPAVHRQHRQQRDGGNIRH